MARPRPAGTYQSRRPPPGPARAAHRSRRPRVGSTSGSRSGRRRSSRGQASGNPRIAGRITSLAVHPDGERIYAGSGNGGVWYSSDGGANWRSLGGFAATNRPEITRPAHRNACGAIFVDFGTTEAGDEVYVGTGEPDGFPNGQPGGSLAGVGVLVATGPATSAAGDPWTREAPNLIGAGVYRFAAEPGGAGLVVATTVGLFERPDPADPDADWERVAGDPFDDLAAQCSDVLWTAGAGTRPERLWVWVRTGSRAGLWARTGTDTDFEQVATPGFQSKRTVLAATTPPSRIYVLNDQGASAPPNLYQVDAASGADPTVTFVRGVPAVLGDQGFYDIGMAVDPTAPDRVVVVGKTHEKAAPDGKLIEDGAVVVGVVADDGAPPRRTFTSPQMLGVGVHADVHAVAFSNGGARLWVGCDGGVYRSDDPTDRAGFRPCNTGLSVAEANYVAGHPTCEGFVVTGLQDNAVITRRSSTVWESGRVGDGGGVVFDPIDPTRFLRQHFRGLWSESIGPEDAEHPLVRGGVRASAEHRASAFYSEAAGIAHHRATAPPDAPDVGQILIGTTRVWYTEDFGDNWVTLPTGNDPLPGNLTRDHFGEPITVCRWQSPDVAWILGESSLQRYSRTPGSDAGGGPGTWTSAPVNVRSQKRKKQPDPDEKMQLSDVWTDVAADLDPPPAAGQPPAQRGTQGAVYLGTIGNPDDEQVDTLYWFDGTDTWHGTGLRNDPDGAPAPVTAIVCDPDHPGEVWVGTTIGVWRGVRTINGADPPTWDWEARVNGLPEAAVEDLEIFSDGGVRLLRAAIAARGLWELRLDTSDVTDLVYVRAHDDDLRHRTRAVETQRDLATPRSWHGSPDVRPRIAPANVPPPSDLHWTTRLLRTRRRHGPASLPGRAAVERRRPAGAGNGRLGRLLRRGAARPRCADRPAAVDTEPGQHRQHVLERTHAGTPRRRRTLGPRAADRDPCHADRGGPVRADAEPRRGRPGADLVLARPGRRQDRCRRPPPRPRPRRRPERPGDAPTLDRPAHRRPRSLERSHDLVHGERALDGGRQRGAQLVDRHHLGDVRRRLGVRRDERRDTAPPAHGSDPRTDAVRRRHVRPRPDGHAAERGRAARGGDPGRHHCR